MSWRLRGACVRGSQTGAGRIRPTGEPGTRWAWLRPGPPVSSRHRARDLGIASRAALRAALETITRAKNGHTAKTASPAEIKTTHQPGSETQLNGPLGRRIRVEHGPIGNLRRATVR